MELHGGRIIEPKNWYRPNHVENAPAQARLYETLPTFAWPTTRQSDLTHIPELSNQVTPARLPGVLPLPEIKPSLADRHHAADPHGLDACPDILVANWGAAEAVVHLRHPMEDATRWSPFTACGDSLPAC